MSILIDPEFRALIPRLSPEERTQLEANLVAEGCRDALVVWRGHGILLDGHNRREICTRLGLAFCTAEVDLPDRDAAKAWIIRNQFGRRNLTPFQRAELALALEPLIAAKAKENLRTAHGGKRGGSPLPTSAKAIDTRLEVAKAAGLGHDTIAKAKRVRDRADEETTQRLRAGELTINRAYQRLKRRETEEKREARREENRRKVDQAPSLEAVLAEAKFATIVVDPPWPYDWDLYDRGLPTYETMPTEDLLELPVGERADTDCHLYLWVTNRFLGPGFLLLRAWGFRYITCLTWCKPHFGMGNYFRGSTEHVLFGVKGSQPLQRKDVGTWFQAPRGPKGHSSKPVEFYELVESCSPDPYLEIFARAERPGWTSWGGEL